MKNKMEKCRYFICFILLFVLCYMFPYTGDDWAWGSSIGLERLSSWFDNYSGRYLGNLIVLVLTRSNIIKTLCMAFCLTGIVFCIEHLTERKISFYISCVFLLLVPRLVFRQAVVWTAGFANYSTSIFFTLLYILYVYWIFKDQADKKKLEQKPLWIVLLIPLGMANTLIVEHLTLYNLLFAFFVIAYVFIRFKKVLIQHLAYFVGTVLGTYLMFSNSVYHSISKAEDGYRSVAAGGIVNQVLNSYFNVIYEELYMNNVWLNLAIAIVCTIICIKYHSCIKKCLLGIMEICLSIMWLYSAWAIFSVVGLGTATKVKTFSWFEGVFTVFAALSVIVFVIIVGIEEKQKLHTLLFIMGSIICMTAPLFVVNPIGSRCFFATYVMFVLLLCELTSMLPEGYVDHAIVKRGCVLISIAAMLFYMGVFTSVYRVDRERLERVRSCVADGQTEIEIIHLPYEDYIWTATPTTGSIWEERYKLFYGLPENITLKDVWTYTK